ncbi:MAG: hypothetical protein CVV64_12490 [Candidatus Wallbacteria bacterium HGW-Wallbacteria-1]|jgi:hypothetical protein|uniref:Uncharacterized protein n=1 Tax=Candidatus Wallbacteria bacterium HGW-Wallbacteria-1 TaxID=2013854 RepID=A0A2N1PNA6_9BACT|nr:MAG: hypothetical protein CVV64_12490 [Candidatus Wallbacteria bacterium HGW-Wallbacteria-1]
MKKTQSGHFFYYFTDLNETFSLFLLNSPEKIAPHTITHFSGKGALNLSTAKGTGNRPACPSTLFAAMNAIDIGGHGSRTDTNVILIEFLKKIGTPKRGPADLESHTQFKIPANSNS